MGGAYSGTASIAAQSCCQCLGLLGETCCLCERGLLGGVASLGGAWPISGGAWPISGGVAYLGGGRGLLTSTVMWAMMARWWPSRVSRAIWAISLSDLPRNIWQAAASISLFCPWIFTCTRCPF